jgi:hypothetical protein
MPASMAGLHGERGGSELWKRQWLFPLCEAAGLPVRRRRLWGERGKAPWLSPGSARLQPRPITTKRAQRSELSDGGDVHEHGKAPLSRGSADSLS